MWISIPNPRSTNPFPSNAVPGGPEYYTVTVSRSAPTGDEANFLQLGDTQLAWIIYRIYVPNKGLERNAGVPLPTITLIGYDGKSQTVPSCHSSRNSDVLSKFIRELTNPHLGADGAFLGARMRPEEFSTIEYASCQEASLVSWIPENTGGYFPNSANKYIAIPGLCLEPDRIVVVRGKGAVFPDSYDGGSIWDPNGVMLRYWSMCNNNEGTPYPVVACQADQFTQLDDQGYYTYVLSEPESGRGNMTGAPSWLPADATWLPWGSRTTPNILIFRNMLPDASFSHSVQVAIQAVCSRQSARCPTISRGDCQGGRMCSQGDGRILSASGLLQ